MQDQKETVKKYRLLGNSGLCSEASLGTMTFGEGGKKRGKKAKNAEGGNFIDTANVYTNGPAKK